MKPSRLPWNDWASVGNAPSSGSPDQTPNTLEKKLRNRLIHLTSQHPDWAIGFHDETWWSRFTQPHLHAWSQAGRPLRLVEQVPTKTDRTLKALACYGLLLRHCPVQAAQWQEELWLRFVADQPPSAITTQFLNWCCGKLQAMG